MYTLWIAVLVAVTALSNANSYEGYSVLEVHPSEESHVLYLRELNQQRKGINILNIIALDSSVYIVVPPYAHTRLFIDFTMKGLTPKVFIQDLQRFLIDEHRAVTQRWEARGQVFDLNDFNTLEDIENQYRVWQADCPQGFTCDITSIGTTYEGRPIESFTVSQGSGRQVLWIDSAIHAREWIAPATTLKMLDNFIYQYGIDADATRIMDTYDLYFICILNPDGYAYTWTEGNRLWRKNRAETGGRCLGVDVNRNFAWDWCEEGATSITCDDTYCGPSPASELETQAVENEIIRLQASNGIVSFITYHSAARMILFPWGNTIDHAGNTCERSDDWEDLNQVANAMADAIEDTYGTNWARGTICETIYAATGGSLDWAKAIEGVKYSFAPELRGIFFTVSPDQIEPSYQENWNGVVAMINEIENVEGAK